MVTVITKNDCIQFNLKDSTREKSFVSTLKYHMKNKTQKAIVVTSSQFDRDTLKIRPCEVKDVYWENRTYDTNVGNEINNMINNII